MAVCGEAIVLQMLACKMNTYLIDLHSKYDTCVNFITVE